LKEKGVRPRTSNIATLFALRFVLTALRFRRRWTHRWIC